MILYGWLAKLFFKVDFADVSNSIIQFWFEVFIGILVIKFI